MKPPLLIIDDEESILESLKRYLEDDYEIFLANCGKEGVNIFKTVFPMAVILDMRMPDMSGLEVLEEIKSIDPNAHVLILTAYGDIETAVKAMKMGAEQFLTKPVDAEALESILRRTINAAKIHQRYKLLKNRFDHLKSTLFIDTRTANAIDLLAKNKDTTVLILGPTGSGKSVVAELIHNHSPRRECPFVDINCAELNEAMLESELFGHERGAFTDAKTTKKGLIEVAESGTMFLDEIGEMPLGVQAKVLKAIETKSFRRMGGTRKLQADIRIIAATNSNLVDRIKEGKFREDLYYRLNVIPITLSPLSEIKDEIPTIAEIFLKEYAGKMNKRIEGFTENAALSLVNYSWPGNFRELRNVIERAMILCEGKRITVHHFPSELREDAFPENQPQQRQRMTLDEAEKQRIAFTLEETGNNKTAAARILGIHVTTLLRKIKKYQLDTK